MNAGQTSPLLESQWLTFACLLPFVSMLVLHDALGLSDAALWLENQLDRDSQLFNFAMIGVFHLSVGSYIVHAAYLAGRSRRWFVIKAVFLILFWCALGWFGGQRDRAIGSQQLRLWPPFRTVVPLR
jgi:hypothetical protein